MATSITSASITLLSPPAAGSTVTARPVFFFSTPVTLVESWKVMPCLVRMRWKALETSRSMPGVTRSRNSTTVTSLPSRFHTEPSSSPITPAPTTSSFLGTAVSAMRAGGGDDLLFVDGDAGQRRDIRAGGDDDVLGGQAADRAVRRFHFDFAGRGDAAFADNAFDLVLLEQEFDALGEFAHHLGLLRHHGGQIEFDLAP